MESVLNSLNLGLGTLFFIYILFHVNFCLLIHFLVILHQVLSILKKSL